MKKIIFFLSFLYSTSIFAFTSCPQALPTTDANFCSSFSDVAVCHCLASGLPRSACPDVNTIYKRMLIIFGSVERACNFQRNTDVQTCIDDWNCFNNGGSDSHGGLCSNSGKACAIAIK